LHMHIGRLRVNGSGLQWAWSVSSLYSQSGRLGVSMCISSGRLGRARVLVSAMFPDARRTGPVGNGGKA